MKLKKTLIVVIVAALAGGAFYAYQRSTALTPEQRYTRQAVEVGELTQTVSANGTLNPVVLVNVGTQVSGTVTKLYVDFNDKVEKGQPLLELDRSLLSAQVRQSAANVGNVTATLELARANEARMKTLFEQEYVSRQEMDQAIQARKSATAQLEQVKAAAEKDQVNLEYTTVRSPVSGIVVDRVVDLGQTVAASLQTPTLIKIAQDLAEMRIDSSFSEADIGKLKEGQKVTFTVDAFPDRRFEGVVQQIRLNAVMQQNVVTYNVRVSLQNPEQILLPGMTAYVTVGVAHRKEVLLIPNAALRFKPDPSEKLAGEATGKSTTKPAATALAASLGTPGAGARQRRPGQNAGAGEGKRRNAGNGISSGTVYVIEDGALKPISIQLGITDNRNTEVLSGELKAGDEVIVGVNLTGSDDKPSSVSMRMF